MQLQNYGEYYWQLTLEYTDINSANFIGTLKIIVDFIDDNSLVQYSKEKYKKLQEEVNKLFPKVDMGSVRKSINQFVKLGFINYELKSYHRNAKDFLRANNDIKRKSIFSKILYTNSSFDRSVTEDSAEKQINFLIKTLEENRKLSKDDVSALMTTRPAEYPKGFLNKNELDNLKKDIERTGFIKRKYNQVSYLWNILGKLDDLTTIKDSLYFEEDAQIILDAEPKSKGRDPYLHRIYKNQLKEESQEILGGVECMVEKLSFPSLVASHIKPFIQSSDEESYDPDNGLLLSQNIDGLFDKGYISFRDDGTIILSNQLDSNLKLYLKKYSLDKVFIKEKRKQYLSYHRNLFKEKLGN